MKIRLNGEAKNVDATTVSSLIVELGLETRMLAVERNLEVVPRSQYETTALCEGDRIEVVHMIGGG
ncbi:MAG: thiamine biosynthesis protein ThiS [Zetaproteobacteria bacterium CG_4_9_14_3_um_filter_49_83]|nr:MAG: thiamine biosynthesis protein ThiS [Zetaproteobacteria bacterium CG1_02_49_23]PIQ34702.1 MAG: thiamine biosynthesis protein ThiS [Zetaproteobacteria bacterium CG17_big_fil_post_rev_8_21_14_2_50_50_13]PIY54997.1 MAG: thiamine biosynthesis protein ThiS [Zetaproteobacteria bacterium CG_4_10_14_0_8_um_filter_49_80]PJA34285.1 MAG: thiamine biosynthesis protein ThiS [Zetaproteobacteria bacterium CG_4_9_14_3_um_filter_49_83]